LELDEIASHNTLLNIYPDCWINHHTRELGILWMGTRKAQIGSDDGTVESP